MTIAVRARLTWERLNMRLRVALESQIVYHLIAAAALIGFVAACSTYSGVTNRPASPLDDNIQRPMERWRTGPTVEEVCRALGEDL